jgi:hypothetical protein
VDGAGERLLLTSQGVHGPLGIVELGLRVPGLAQLGRDLLDLRRGLRRAPFSGRGAETCKALLGAQDLPESSGVRRAESLVGLGRVGLLGLRHRIGRRLRGTGMLGAAAHLACVAVLELAGQLGRDP